MTDLLISTIIPVYNGSLYLREALHSVLSQTYKNQEIIVVNDGSTDETEDIIKEFQDKTILIHKQNEGISSARNLGIARSKGDLINFVDHDDLCPSDRLNSLAKAFEKDPGLSIVFGHVIEFSHDENLLKSRAKTPQRGQCCGAMMLKRNVFKNIGLFDNDLRVGEFLDFLLRVQDSELETKQVSQVVLRRRIHERNNSYLNRDRLKKEYTEVIHRALCRRKKL